MVVIKDGAICGVLRAQDIIAGHITVAGKLLPAGAAAPVLGQFAKAMTPMLNKEICTTYEDTADGLLAKVRVNGVYDPELDQYVKWIDPSEGYRVSP
jgi:hypothetical protein